MDIPQYLLLRSPPESLIFGEMTLGERIERLRTDLGYSREKFSELIGRSAMTVYSWERGKSEPKASDSPIIAKALGTTVAYLIGETDDPSLTVSTQSFRLRSTGELSNDEIEDLKRELELIRREREIRDILRTGNRTGSRTNETDDRTGQ